MAADPNRQRVAIRYRAEDGNYYSVVTSRNHAAAVGATGALAADPPLPTKWKPRRLHGLQIQAGHDRTLGLVVPDKTSGIWRGTTNTITVAPYGTLDITGRSGERRTQGAPPFDGVGTPPNERVSIRYDSDNGNSYAYVTTRAIAFALGAPGSGGQPAFPKAWTPRHIDLINPNLTGRDQRKVIVAPDPTAAYYTQNTTYVVTINGVTYNTTGRIEEDRPNGAPSYVP
jgi:hypothetical protein